jgi:hypothetical protein
VAGDIAPNIDDYLRGVFYETWVERQYKKYYHPKLIHSAWAATKYANYTILRDKNMLTPCNMDKAYITRTTQLIQETPDLFDREDGLIPECLHNWKAGELSPAYCVMSPGFWRMFDNLDPDIKETFFHVDQLYYLKKKIFRYPELYKFIKEML